MYCGNTNHSKYAKCYLVIIIIAVTFCSTFVNYAKFAYAEEPENNLQQELENKVEDYLNNIDFSELEQYFNENADYYYNIFGISDYKEFLIELISGNILTDFNSVFDFIAVNIKENLSLFLSPLLLILVISLICVVFKSIRPKAARSSVSEVIFFICFSAIICILTIIVGNMFSTVKIIISRMQNQMNAIFPILLFLMNAAGGSISVKAFQPIVLLLSNSISNIFVNVLLPIVVIVFVLAMVGNLSPNSKLNGLTDFFKSAFKWIIGIVFTVYMAFMGIQGITASSADGISIRTAKFAIKNYIPMLGGYISDGFEVARVGASIIKNAVGFSGIILILTTVLSPIIIIAILQLSLKLVAGIVEPLSESRTGGLLIAASKSISMLVTIIIGVAMMYFVIVFLLMCSVSGAI